MSGAVPGPSWYPDPAGRYEVRYWDGAGWTEHVFGGGVQTLDPLPNAASSTALAVVEARPVVLAEQTKAPSRRAIRKQDKDEFESTSLAAAHGEEAALCELPAVVERARQHYWGSKFQKRAWEIIAIAVRDVLQHDRVSGDEEGRLLGLAEALGLDLSELPQRNFDLYEELVIARINDGRLPHVSTSAVLTKPGEIVHALMAVQLMKEVAVREMRGGSSGVSVHVAKGVSYRVGQFRAHSVVVGSELQVQDGGNLALTSQRAVFLGSQKTLEFRYDRLIGMEQFRDGLRLNVSNRQTASLLKFPAGQSPAIAAAIITAVQQ